MRGTPNWPRRPGARRTVPIAERPRTDDLVMRPGRSPRSGRCFRLDSTFKAQHEMPFTHRQLTLVLSLLLFFAFGVHASDDKQPIAPQDAQKHVGEEITIEMQVKAAKKSAKMKKVFLDSTE